MEVNQNINELIDNDNNSIIIPNINIQTPGTIDYKKIVDNIIAGNVKPDGPIIETPKNMKLELKLHQKRILYEMVEKEKFNERSSDGINMGVIGDKVGSGKSIMLLALLTMHPEIKNNMKYSNKLNIEPPSHSYMCGFEYNPDYLISSNLIVVPHGIFNQWEKYIKDYTNLTLLSISTINQLNKHVIKHFIPKLSNYDIILVKSTKFGDFMRRIYQYKEKDISCEDSVNSVLKSHCEFTKNDLIKNLDNMRSSFLNTLTGSYEKFINSLKDYKKIINSIDIEGLEKNIEAKGNYMLKKIKKINCPIFERVIIDEANSINLPNCPEAYGKYNWFITSSVKELLFPFGKKDYSNNKIIINGINNIGFIKNIFSLNSRVAYSNFLSHYYLKNKDTYVEGSFNLPDPITKKIECYTPKELLILKDVGLPEVINALNAGDTKSAIEMVGCEISNQDSIIDSVLNKLNNEHVKLNLKINEKKNELNEIISYIGITQDSIEVMKNQVYELSNEELLNENSNSLEINGLITNATEELNKYKSKKYTIKKIIDNSEKKREELEFKIESLKNRINDIVDKECPICTEKMENPALTKCCKNVLCFECITTSLKYNKEKGKCPYCRSALKLSELTIIDINSKFKKSEDKKTKKKIILPTKLNTLISILKNKPDGKFLIFSEFDNSFSEIISSLMENNISYSKLQGSGGHITNIVDDFKKGKIKVLMLNAKHYGSGLNLQMSTDIILYHRMTKEMESQIIGRGQRLGRTEPLNISYLCFENELNQNENINNPIVNSNNILNI
jgi:hypothetical protein